MNNSPGVDEVEGIVGVGKIFSIGDPDFLSGQPVNLEAFSDMLHSLFGKIHTIGFRTSAYPLDEVCPSSYTDLEYLPAVITGELGERKYLRLNSVSVFFDLIKILLVNLSEDAASVPHDSLFQ